MMIIIIARVCNNLYLVYVPHVHAQALKYAVSHAVVCYYTVTLSLTHIHTHTHTDSPDEATLPQGLNFITGCSSIPPLRFKQKLHVKYQPGTGLAEADVCFNAIRLPSQFQKKKIFFYTLDKSILYSFGYFGRV